MGKTAEKLGGCSGLSNPDEVGIVVFPIHIWLIVFDNINTKSPDFEDSIFPQIDAQPN